MQVINSNSPATLNSTLTTQVQDSGDGINEQTLEEIKQLLADPITYDNFDKFKGK